MSLKRNATWPKKIEGVNWAPSGRPDRHGGWMTGYVRGLELVANYLNPNDVANDWNLFAKGDVLLLI